MVKKAVVKRGRPKSALPYKVIEGGICAPEGFFSAGFHCGVKKSTKRDIALVYAPEKCTAAGVFTKNKIQAAPVIISRNNLKNGFAQALIINSGNANACTGEQGMHDALSMMNETAESLKINPCDVLIASTGIIGVPMPMKKIVGGIWTLSRMINNCNSSKFAEAIMTTDLRPKEIAVEISFGAWKKIRIGGVAKGSGMICPNMATMIAAITTDAKIDPKLLKRALSDAISESFNMLTVDNDMSTNDCAFILASGRSEKIVSGKGYDLFYQALKHVCVYLAKEIARDGEGATKLITVEVKNAKTKEDARKAAKAVAGSSLVKCAVFGADPNFGRVLASLGYSGANIDPNKIDVYVEGVLLVSKGSAAKFDEKAASEAMKNSEVRFTVDLNNGVQSAIAWGCDMTEGYITINAKYHT